MVAAASRSSPTMPRRRRSPAPWACRTGRCRSRRPAATSPPTATASDSRPASRPTRTGRWAFRTRACAPWPASGWASSATSGSPTSRARHPAHRLPAQAPRRAAPAGDAAAGRPSGERHRRADRGRGARGAPHARRPAVRDRAHRHRALRRRRSCRLHQLSDPQRPRLRAALRHRGGRGPLATLRAALPGHNVEGFPFVLADEPKLAPSTAMYRTIGWTGGDALHCRVRAVFDPGRLTPAGR